MSKGFYTMKAVYSLSAFLIVLMLLLQLFILRINHNREAKSITSAYLKQVESIIEKNKHQEEALLASLKEDYTIHAKAVSFFLDHNNSSKQSLSDLQKFCTLMSIDEINIFNEKGVIVSSSVPKYIGYSFDSGEQMAFFKPMLSDKKLSMCQDITPNTVEGKPMVYAITWNEAKDKMIQVGIEPVRLLNELASNNIQRTVNNIPLDENMSIDIVEKNSLIIIASTAFENLGKNLVKIGNIQEDSLKSENFLKKCVLNDKRGGAFCSIGQNAGFYICIFLDYNYFVSRNIESFIMLSSYLFLAFLVIIPIIKKLFTSRQIIDEEKKLTQNLYKKSHLDELTDCYNRRAYNKDILTFIDENKPFAYLSLDLNALKSTNDSLGHEAGDELILAAVKCMSQAFSDIGEIYRIGGDEFVVLIYADEETLKDHCRNFDENLKNWKGKLVKNVSVSYDYVLSSEVTGKSIEEIANLADRRMYSKKSKYYIENGLNRRRT
ncbi:MAG: GGDEF domain-containing protein [Treponema sp.]|nr:GGDEF domain-containing protein [Treponema sp.]